MPTATTFTTNKQFLGIAKETSQGTAVAPTFTLPVEKFQPEDKPVWLDDKAWRGSMVDFYGRQQGVIKTEFSMSGPAFGDGIGFLLANILGDLTATGTTTTPTGTLSAGSSVSATSVSSSVSIPNGTLIQIDVGNNAEIVTTSGVPTGVGPYTIPVPALTKAHLSGVAITAVTTPYTSAFSLLNSGQGQPISHTFTHFQATPASTGTRQYPGSCLSELSLKWNAESQLMTFDAKGLSWPSVIAGATPTSSPSTATPVASWRGVLGIGGPASGGTLVKTITDGEISIKRELDAIFTTQGVQVPYIIQRGAISVSGKLNFIADSESPFLAMMNNTQPQLQFLLDNGVAGANNIKFQADMQNAAYKGVKYDAGKTAVAYQVDFDAVANVTNAGFSGGFSPIKFALTNAITSGTYQ